MSGFKKIELKDIARDPQTGDNVLDRVDDALRQMAQAYHNPDASGAGKIVLTLDFRRQKGSQVMILAKVETKLPKLDRVATAAFLSDTLGTFTVEDAEQPSLPLRHT